MIRNLKVLSGAMLALAAFGVIEVSGAQAAEFHCSIGPCRVTLNPDGEGKNTHHVFIIDDKTTGESISFTCPRLTGDGTITGKTASEISLTNLSYDKGCTVAGSIGVEVEWMGCGIDPRADGGINIRCPPGFRVRIIKTEGGACTYEIGEQGPLSKVTYTTIGTEPNREVTISTNVTGIAVTMTGTTAGCILNPAHTFEGTYTTGNTKVTAESDPGEVMADGWWL